MKRTILSKSFLTRIKQTALAACSLALMLGASQTTIAAVLTWHDGTGNMLWDTNSLNWVSGATPTTWNNATPDDAIFGATGVGSVDLATNITADSITFNVDGYSITNNTLTLGGTLSSITNNADATISSSLAGVTGLTKQGVGTLTLDSAIYTGNTIINGGTLSIVQGTGFASASVTFATSGFCSSRVGAYCKSPLTKGER